MTSDTSKRVCICGCGQKVSVGRLFVHGHNRRKPRNIISCACGCNGQLVDQSKWGYKRQYIPNHRNRGHVPPVLHN